MKLTIASRVDNIEKILHEYKQLKEEKDGESYELSLNVIEAISDVSCLIRYEWFMRNLSVLGKKLEKDGKIELKWGDYYSLSALEHIMKENGLEVDNSVFETE